MAGISLMTANAAAAVAAELAGFNVISLCPTLQLADLARSLESLCGRENASRRYVDAESERSALAVLTGAAQAGAAAFTSASTQSLASAHEMMSWTANARLPVVMAACTGALGPGINIWADTTDAAAQRDCGWIQLFCESNQEVLDSILIARRLSHEVSLPVMVCYESFVHSRSLEPVSVPERSDAERFLGSSRKRLSLDTERPATHCQSTGPDYQMEFRHKMHEAHESAKDAFADAAVDFARLFHRSYAAVETLPSKNAEFALAALGSMAGTARAAVEAMRRAGRQAGFIKVRMIRPLPWEEMRDAIAAISSGGVRRVFAVDRNAGPGAGGMLAEELRAALAEMPGAPPVTGIHAGLGGREARAGDIAAACAELLASDAEKRTFWLGLKI